MRANVTSRQSASHRHTGNLRIARLIVANVVVAAVFLAWRVVEADGGSDAWSSRALLATGIIAAMIALVNARSVPDRRGWWLAIAAGSLVWVLANPLRGSNGQTTVLIFGGAFLITAMLLGASCLRMAGLGQQRGTVKPLLVDIFPPIVSLLTAVWIVNIGPFVESSGLSWHFQVAAAVHGLAAVALVVVGLTGLLASSGLQKPGYVQTMMSALTIVAIADGIWLQRWIDRDPTFGVLGDLAFCIGFATLGVAGLQARLIAGDHRTRRAARVVPPRVGRQTTAGSLLILFVLIGAQAIWGEATRHGIALSAIAGLTVVLFVVMWENLVTVREEALAGEILQLSQRIDGLISQVGRDPLTGLLNRKAFSERLEYELVQARVNGRPLALAMIDVDNFKTVNDTLGHTVGDQVLQAIASILVGAARTSDIVARFAGDEFVMIFPAVDEQVAGAVAERVVASVQRINAQLGLGREASIGLSIGVAFTESCKRNVAQLIAIADAAMYDAKEAGKSRVMAVNADTLTTRSYWGAEPANAASSHGDRNRRGQATRSTG